MKSVGCYAVSFGRYRRFGGACCPHQPASSVWRRILLSVYPHGSENAAVGFNPLKLKEFFSYVTGFPNESSFIIVLVINQLNAQILVLY